MSSSNNPNNITNNFFGSNVMTEEELSKLAMGQATSGSVEPRVTLSDTVGADDAYTTVHVVRHGKRGSHCLKVEAGCTVKDVMNLLAVDTGDTGAWNVSSNTFSVRVDGGDLNDDCDNGYTFSEGESTLIVSPKVVGG
jgi:hypothetical protein